MPPNTVKVDRSTRWGNPFKVGSGYAAADAVADYRRWIGGVPTSRPVPADAERPHVAEIRQHLRNRNLACWCRVGEPCHADELLRIANEN